MADNPNPALELFNSDVWRIARSVYGVFLILLQAYLWIGFLDQTTRSPAPSADVIQYSFAIANGVGAVIWCYVRQRRTWLMGFWVVFTLSQLLVNFSYLYWSHGTNRNFTVPLTHIGAIYFALGTLSTAGTGNIAAITDWSRGIQALQQALDLAFVLIGVGLFVARLAALRKEHQ